MDTSFITPFGVQILDSSNFGYFVLTGKVSKDQFTSLLYGIVVLQIVNFGSKMLYYCFILLYSLKLYLVIKIRIYAYSVKSIFNISDHSKVS